MSIVSCLRPLLYMTTVSCLNTMLFSSSNTVDFPGMVRFPRYFHIFHSRKDMTFFTHVIMLKEIGGQNSGGTCIGYKYDECSQRPDTGGLFCRPKWCQVQSLSAKWRETPGVECGVPFRCHRRLTCKVYYWELFHMIQDWFLWTCWPFLTLAWRGSAVLVQHGMSFFGHDCWGLRRWRKRFWNMPPRTAAGCSQLLAKVTLLDSPRHVFRN